MGLTGFNRQRKQALSKAFGIDASLADKLLAYGYTTPEAVRKADELPFLSEDELKHLKKHKDTAPTVQEIQDSLPGLTLEEATELLEAETKGKNRKTAIEAIESRIEELSESDVEPPGEGDETDPDNSDETEPEEAPEQVEATNDLDDRFLALPDDTVFPSHYGGGNYYLSNGEKVSGKDDAKAAQSELDGE